jgi:hypothetical protein
MLPVHNISETSGANEELNQLLQDINKLPEGANPNEFEKIKHLKILNFLKSERSVGIANKDFIEIIKGADFKDETSKLSLMTDFLKSERSVGIANKDFIEIIKGAEFKGERSKLILMTDFLKSERSSSITPQDFANMIKEVGMQNRADLSTNLFVDKFSASENYIKNFIDFIKELHPSEAMQCEFVKKFINKNQINQSNLFRLKPFIEGLQDNDLALDLIDNLSRKRILVDEVDTLSLVKNRSSKQYAFLTEIVGGKALNDCITEDGIEILKATFGDNLKVSFQSITISDLISYYDLKGQTSSLSAMLKPEFKQKLRDNFAPSAQMLLYKPTELEKLNSLLSEEGVAFDVKSYFVENTTLCDYLKEKVGPIDAIESGKTYQINFTNFGFDNSSEDRSQLEKQAEINTLFNKLLKSSDRNKEEVVRFFEDLLGITLSEFDERKKNKLTSFFQQNKKELAHCFCNENLPKENFESLFTTFYDGCMENIGAQFKKMLYGAMIKDEHAQILYAVADDKIFSGIINNHGSDIMVGNFNPINNEIIKAYSLSPMALIEKLSKEEMLTSAKAWEIFQKNLGDNHEIIERLSEKYPVIEESKIEDFNKKAKEIASYLIVKNVVGEEKMTDLESKNPQLKELGDFIYGEVREASIVDRAPASPHPSPRILQQDRDVTTVSCFNLSGLFNCFRGSRS